MNVVGEIKELQRDDDNKIIQVHVHMFGCWKEEATLRTLASR